MPAKLRESNGVIVYGRTRGDKGLGWFVAILFGIPFLFTLLMTLEPQHFGPGDSNRGIGILGVLVFGFFAGWGLVLTRPREIELSPTSRTYTLISAGKRRSGSYDDFAGLALICVSSRTGPLRYIRLRFKDGTPDVPFYFSRSDEEARSELSRLASTLQIPTVESSF